MNGAPSHAPRSGSSLTPRIRRSLAGPDLNGSESGDSIEGLFFFDWTYFELHTPKSQMHVSFDYYPSLSESSRQRGDLNARYRQEFVKDQFWSISCYYISDSDPPAGAVSEQDYGVVSGLEYKF